MVFGPDGLCHLSVLHIKTRLRRNGEELGASWGRSETTFRPMNKASRGRGGWCCPSGGRAQTSTSNWILCDVICVAETSHSWHLLPSAEQMRSCLSRVYPPATFIPFTSLLFCFVFRMSILYSGLPWTLSWPSTLSSSSPQLLTVWLFSQLFSPSSTRKKSIAVNVFRHQPFVTEITITK